MSPGDGLPPKDTADKSLGDIVSEVSEKASFLVREEIELAKAEVNEKVSNLGRGSGIGAAAAVFLIFAITMFFHGLAWFFNDLFNWEGSVWPGFMIVFLLLTILAIIAALIARRLFQRSAPPTPNLAIEEAKRTRAELEGQTIQRDQLERSLERGKEAKP